MHQKGCIAPSCKADISELACTQHELRYYAATKRLTYVLQWSLSEGAGARRLGEVRTRAAIQLLLVQACGEIFHEHSRRLEPDAITGILNVVQSLADHARQVDKDMPLRRQLAAAQAHNKVPCSWPLLCRQNADVHALCV